MNERIDEQYFADPGLLVLDITAADEATARAAMTDLDAMWMTSGAPGIRRVPGEVGVRARVYAVLRRPAGHTAQAAGGGSGLEAKSDVRATETARLYAGHERLHGLFPGDR